MKRLAKIIIIEIILIGIILSYFLLRDSGFTTIENTLSKKIQDTIEEITIDKTNIYTKIENALLEGDKEIEFRDLSLLLKAEEVFNILDQIVYENPKIMYYKGAEYRLGKLTIHYSKLRKKSKHIKRK